MSQQDSNICVANIQKDDWFAFRVRPRHEKAVALQLREKEQEYFLPIVRETRKWANRLAHVDLPLFPGYIFGRTQRSALLAILQTPAVIDVLRTGSQPVPIEEQEILALKKAINANVHIEPYPYIEAGEKVYINNGPLVGLSGIVVNVRNARRLVLSLTLLHRSVLVELSPASIARACHAPVFEFGHDRLAGLVGRSPDAPERRVESLSFESVV
jgi:transcription antitermination factor NusG